MFSQVLESREIVKSILLGQDSRFLMVLGPCSLYDKESALKYADKVLHWQKEFGDKMYFVMRAYTQKPRTTLGWKGVLAQPDFNAPVDFVKGAKYSREVLEAIVEKGVPIANEILYPWSLEHMEDLLSYGAIGARSSENQAHREIASSLDFPIGFKNATSGLLEPGINGAFAASQSQYIRNLEGETVLTKGNPLAHLILRGGSVTGPNYGMNFIHEAEGKMKRLGLDPTIIIDASHANSLNEAGEKDYRLQEKVVLEVLKNRHSSVKGFMLESNLLSGKTSIENFTPGCSVTDPCLGIEETTSLLKKVIFNS